jgi:hypothetical protein
MVGPREMLLESAKLRGWKGLRLKKPYGGEGDSGSYIDIIIGLMLYEY